MEKLIALIEARDSSVLFCKVRQPQKRKGDTAEVPQMPECAVLGRQRISAELSQNTLWSAIIGHPIMLL